VPVDLDCFGDIDTAVTFPTGCVKLLMLKSPATGVGLLMASVPALSPVAEFQFAAAATSKVTG
jgi:hypothetical protein